MVIKMLYTITRMKVYVILQCLDVHKCKGGLGFYFIIFKKNLSRLIFQLEISNRVSNSMVETYLQVNIKVSDIYVTKF